MKSLLIATAVAFAFSGAALAQPAYDASQGAAPTEYPKCTKPGQDRCVSSGHMAKGKAGHHKMRHKAHKAAAKGGATSRDGERG